MAESPERKALEHLLSTLVVGAFAVPIEEVARRIEALYRPAPDAAERERVIEECAKVARQFIIEKWLSIQSGDEAYKEIRRLAEKP